MALFLVVDEFALVLAVITIYKHTVAVHLVVNEVPRVTASIGPRVLALTFHFVVAEHAFVAGAVEHSEFSTSMSESIIVLAFEVPIVPLLFAKAMLLIAFPFTLIDGLISPYEFAISIFLIVFPIADVIRAIWVKHPALPVVLIVGPIPVISHPAGPDAPTHAVSERTTPLAQVLGILCVDHFVS